MMTHIYVVIVHKKFWHQVSLVAPVESTNLDLLLRRFNNFHGTIIVINILALDTPQLNV